MQEPKAGDKVRINIRSWLGPRDGEFTGTVHKAGTAQVNRYAIKLPHSRTKTRSSQVSCRRHEFDIT